MNGKVVYKVDTQRSLELGAYITMVRLMFRTGEENIWDRRVIWERYITFEHDPYQPDPVKVREALETLKKQLSHDLQTVMAEVEET